VLRAFRAPWRDVLSLLVFVACGVAALARDAAPPAAPASPAAPAHERTLPARIASYTLTAKLDAARHSVHGKGHITFLNASRAPLRELYFHLYLNAFKNEKSLYLRSPFGSGRSGARGSDWGYVDLKRLVARELGGVDLLPGRRRGTPDPDDETDIAVALPRAIEPGERVTLELEFESKLPNIVERTGYAGDFHFVAQWFPKLAKLEPDGTFAHFPFDSQAEFYADFGDYDVTLDVPDGYVVGATGREVTTKKSGGRSMHRFVAEAVHDFAWTAYPGFQERRARVGGVDVRLMFPEEHAHNAALSLESIEHSLPLFSRLYGAYPYPTLTVVHPPETAANAGGMEYPTLITTGGPWFAGWTGARSTEAVTVHELAHQWFYGLIASNEARYPFLDEGLTSYAENRALDAAYGPGSLFSGFGLEISVTEGSRAFAALRGEDAALASPAAEFPGFGSLAALVYSRGATLLETFARVYGREQFERALALYAERFRFGHPTPEDLERAVGETLGQGAADNLRRALHERGRVDYVLRGVESAKERSAAGLFDDEGQRATRLAEPLEPQRYRGKVVVFRHGDLAFPVEVELVDSAGVRTRHQWNGQGAFGVIDYRGTAPLAHAYVDPDRRVLLDDDLLNNAASASPGSGDRSFERALYFAELFLGFFGP
jgi:hypothetical protein